MRGSMFCPKDRGGCGKQLDWDDGAFCKECMTKTLNQRLRKMGIKERNEPFGGREHDGKIQDDNF